MKEHDQSHETQEHGQFALLKTRRFLPYFLTQALGAFNDNVYKFALIQIVTFGLFSSVADIDKNFITNLAAGLFILPFFIFSPLAGQFADKYEKSQLIRKIKLFEIGVMGLACFAIWQESIAAMILLLFAMGTQSAFFGPVKFSILPQNLNKEELVGGNALVETGTFLAILLGTIVAGYLASATDVKVTLPIAVVVFAVLGYLVCRSIPKAEAPSPELKINWNPVTELSGVWKRTLKNRPVYLSIMAISWFWFIGSSYLTQFSSFTKDVLNGNPEVSTLLLTLFSIGIALGSLLCERLSGRKIELGIVPIGSIGMSVFGIDLFFAVPDVTAENIGAVAFIQNPENWRLMIDLLLIAMFAGLYIVPLNALIQQRSNEKERAQVIAASNIIGALFMFVSAGIAMFFLSVLELSIPEYFCVLAIMNLVVAGYIYAQVPEFVLRFCIWILSHTMYRVSHKNLENLPDEGAAVIVANHVSFVDALLIAGACRRPLRFVMDKPIYESKGLNWFFKLAKTIPITSERRDPAAYQSAMDQVSQALAEGEVVCIFPEGRLTRDGEIDTFRRGIELILERNPVPVLPVALRGLWGSFFSHGNGAALKSRPKRFWSKVDIWAGDLLTADQVSAPLLESKVKDLRGDLA
ncbi:MFS transporter [Litoribrevibacter albus]|uniref:MFS transporter n=1 Tax=Litoribrevibacter albus TaxID=1473156 RepID=A0AA37SBD2_9GAMM|nr:MFS transporter [Litoribrevibacter albus]GLQ32962.1 MFS transporter [Litoribrevibacter albus]